MCVERANDLARTILRPFGIPAITPLALGIFRTLLGLGFIYIVLVYQPIRANELDIRRPYSPLADAGWVYALAINQTATFVMEVVACVAAVLFTLGVFARPAYILLVGLMLVNVLMILAQSAGHDWDLPIVTLLVMTAVPWGAAPSVFEMRRSWNEYSAERLASRAYGFAVWLPGLTIGLAFAAAAYAKVGLTGIRWITNGTVRYHFVEDGRNAPVTLGLWIASHPSIAVAVSLAAVLIEAGFIFVIFARGWRARAAFGVVGASLMAGFTLFQGVRWWPWRILFLSFLPWVLLTSTEREPAASSSNSVAARRDLTWVHALLVVALAGNQLWASYRAIEIEPFVSNFPMYNYTWSSTDEFDRNHVRARFEVDSMDISKRIEAADGRSVLRDMATLDRDSVASNKSIQKDLVRFSARYRSLYGSPPPSAIDVILVERRFDWQKGIYLPETQERIGTVHLAQQ